MIEIILFFIKVNIKFKELTHFAVGELNIMCSDDALCSSDLWLERSH